MRNKRHSIFYTGLPVAAALLLLLAFFFALPGGGALAAPDAPNAVPVFINELHYDNDGADANEGVEVAGPAGTDLSGWTLVPYNGSNGTQYNVTALSGVLPDLQNGYGAIFFPIAGLQNGAPDGIALVDASNTVVQFLSYEGFFTATDGPANGMTSVDIGVSEPGSTPVGQSLQLEGSGNDYEDFTWTGPIANTYDAINTGQAFTAASFTISKTAPEQVSPGETFTYTLEVINSTGISTTGTIITDVLPAGLTFVSASDGGVYASGVVSWTIPTTFTNGATISRTFQATAPATTGAEIVNDMYAVHASEWITLTYGAPITTTIASLDLIVTKVGPEMGFAGEDLSYMITIDNSAGVTNAMNVVVTDTLPVSITGVIYASDALTVTDLGDQIVWEYDEVISGTVETIYLTATVDAAAPNGLMLTNEVEATTMTAGDNPENNTDLVETTIYSIVPIATARAGSNGEIFAVEGQVTYVPGTYNGTSWGIQDASGGLNVYFNPPPTVNLYDEVILVATRGAYNGEDQLTTPVISFDNLGAGAVVLPTAFSTADLAAGLSEGWLIQVAGTASDVPASCGYNHSFMVNDGSGPGSVYIDGTTGVNVCDLGLQDGDYVTIVGFSTEYNGLFQAKPRFLADVTILRDAPDISKAAASNVDVGDLLTYTLTVENLTGEMLHNIVITDAVPASNATFAYALDGGSLANDIVTWNAGDLADQSQLEVRFVVTATGNVGSIITNDTYAFTATEWLTPTFGNAVTTIVGDYIPIPVIQGSDFRSPLEGQTVTTQGEVIGFFEGNSSDYGNFDGFFIQDPLGDSDAATSDAVFINHRSLNISVALGDMVEVTGVVAEFSEYDGTGCYGNECLTQVTVSNADDVIVLPMAAPLVITPTELNPPGDPTASDIYFEALEAMLITLPNTSTVVGPTSYGAVQVVRGDLGIDRVVRGSAYEGMPVAVRNWEFYGDINGGDAPNLIVGSTIMNADGPLNFSYGDYMIVTQEGNEWEAVTEASLPDTIPSWPQANVDEFSVVTFNTYNFDSGDNATKQAKVVAAIEQTNGAAFIALQEIEGDDTAFMTSFLADLAAAGYDYDYAYSHSDVGGHGVSLLWNTALVTNVSWSTAYQGCSPYGSSSSDYDPLWATCRAMDEYPTFSRRPVVLTGTLQLDSGNQEVVVIANHFKSKLGGEAADMRRVDQGTLVNALVADFIDAGSVNVIVMGDLNDFEDSPTLEALYANEVLTNTWFTYDAAPYSYIYKGVSQILDHILVSPAMEHWLGEMGPLHFNADFPFNPYSGDGSVVWRTTDHDLVAATMVRPALEIDFTSNTPVTLGEQAIFTATLINGAEPITYTWDFGDGTETGMGMMVTHTYTATGTYSVTLMASNVYETVQIIHEFVVEEAPVEMHTIYLPLIFQSED